MKRYIAAGLSALLLCSMCAPAYAADAGSGEQAAEAEENAPVSLSFDTLEQTVRENNVSIKSYDNTVKSEEETDVSVDYDMDYITIVNQISSYRQQIADLKKAIDDLDDDVPDQAALKSTLQAQLRTLERNLQAAHSSYNELDDKEDDAKEDQQKTVVSTRREMQNAADQICKDAENNYISLEALQYSLNETERSLAQLDRNIAAVEKQVALGMAGPNQLKSLQSQRETLLASQTTLNTQYESLSNTLAIQCGYHTGTVLRTAALPAVTQEQLDAMDYEADLKEAVKNSYSIWAKQDAADRASDDYEDNVTNNLYAYEAAKIALDAEKENVTASFRKLYKDVQEKGDALRAANADLGQAEKTFAVQQVQYQRGMISQMAFADAQDALEAAQEAAAAAEINLFTSYNTYEWAKRGVMDSAA